MRVREFFVCLTVFIRNDDDDDNGDDFLVFAWKTLFVENLD